MLSKQEETENFTIALSLDIGIVTLNSEDIAELYFIEDIYHFCNTGKLTFVDKDGILEFGPITGNELMTLYYGELDEKEINFKIYKMSKITRDSNDSGNRNSIELYFSDFMFHPMNFIQVSKSWSNKRISNIIKDISENMLGVQKWGKFENTKESLECFYTPYWTVNNTIKWLMDRCRGAKSRQPGYLYYNNTEGTNFVTMDTLLNEEKLLKLSNQDDGLYVFDDSNLFLYNKILNWWIDNIDSLSLRKISGGTNFGYNTLTKSFIVKENTFKKSVKNTTILGKYSLLPDLTEKRIGYQYLNESDESTLDNIFNSNWKKTYNIQQLLSIIVKGHEGRVCGEIIEIKWPSKLNETEKYNKNLSGKYLIRGITHYFSGYTKPSYMQRLTLIKNGYEDLNTRFIHKSTKRNTV